MFLMKNHRSAFIWALSLLAVLLIQFLATARLGVPGYLGVNPESDIFRPSEYVGSFRPHVVVAYMTLVFAMVWVADFLLSRRQASSVYRYLPILLVVTYTAVLFLFISSDRIYQDPDFRDGLVHIDPFQVFFIPFYVALIFVFFPVFLTITGLRLLKSTTNRG
ncbi:MAG: hypothetical protein CR958_00685 [Rhodobacterales bacterium]|nr:MAG: hypothetical protein CR958_00685 [Rhodobacterales bacterium]